MDSQEMGWDKGRNSRLYWKDYSFNVSDTEKVLLLKRNYLIRDKGKNQSILKEISTEYALEGLMLKLKLQYFGHLMQRANSLEKTLMLGEIEGRKSRG